MLTIDDINKLKSEIDNSSNRRVQLETEIRLIKKDMREKYGVDNTPDADELIKDLAIEQEKIKKIIETKLNILSEAMKKDGML